MFCERDFFIVNKVEDINKKVFAVLDFDAFDALQWYHICLSLANKQNSWK